MSRNKFGMLVRKHIVEGSTDEYLNVVCQRMGDYHNVYQALNNMLNILYEKDAMGVDGAADKVVKITGVTKKQAEEIVRAHKKYKVVVVIPKDKRDYFDDKYNEFRIKVCCLCQESASFKQCFAPNDYMEAVEAMDKNIQELCAIHGLGLDGVHNTFKDLVESIESVIDLSFSNIRAEQLIYPLVLYHPLYTGAEKNVNKKKKNGINHPKYKDFRKVVAVICNGLACFRSAFVHKSYDEAIRNMDGKIREFYTSNGISDNGQKETINDLERYIEYETGYVFDPETTAKYIEPMVINHPLYQTTETIEKNKKESVVMKAKKTRGHDKYRFFINKPRTEITDSNRVLEEAEKEGYDLVAINNTSTVESPYIYCTDAVFKLLDKNTAFNTDFNKFGGRKGWNLIYTSLTITELFEAIKKAEESKVKVVVERYRVKVKS